MDSAIRNPKDFWSGAIFLGFGLAAVLIARNYSMGTAGNMGPAYFPTMIGALLTGVGAIAMVRSMVTEGQSISRINWKGLALILGAAILFGLLVSGAGLPVATIVMVLVSGMASTNFKALPFLVFAIAMAVFCTLVFAVGLGLPLPIRGAWFNF